MRAWKVLAVLTVWLGAAATLSGASLAEAGEGCPCDLPPCSCEPREVVEPEVVSSLAPPCARGDPCYVEAEVACHLDNSCAREPVKAKTVKRISGEDTVIVVPPQAADAPAKASKPAAAGAAAGAAAAASGDSEGSDDSDDSEDSDSAGDAAPSAAAPAAKSVKAAAAAVAASAKKPSAAADTGATVPTLSPEQAKAKQSAAAVKALESKLNEEMAKIAQLKKSLAAPNPGAAAQKQASAAQAAKPAQKQQAAKPSPAQAAKPAQKQQAAAPSPSGAANQAKPPSAAATAGAASTAAAAAPARSATAAASSTALPAPSPTAVPKPAPSAGSATAAAASQVPKNLQSGPASTAASAQAAASGPISLAAAKAAQDALNKPAQQAAAAASTAAAAAATGAAPATQAEAAKQAAAAAAAAAAATAQSKPGSTAAAASAAQAKPAAPAASATAATLPGGARVATASATAAAQSADTGAAASPAAKATAAATAPSGSGQSTAAAASAASKADQSTAAAAAQAARAAAASASAAAARPVSDMPAATSTGGAAQAGSTGAAAQAGSTGGAAQAGSTASAAVTAAPPPAAPQNPVQQAAAKVAVQEDPRTTEAIRAAQAAEKAALQAKQAAAGAADSVKKQTQAYAREAELRKAEAIAAKAASDVLKLKLEQALNSSTSQQVAELQKQVKELAATQVQSAKDAADKEAKALAADQKAQAALDAQLEKQKAEVARLIQQLGAARQAADAKVLKEAEDRKAQAAAAEKAAEEKKKDLDKKAVLAAQVTEQGTKTAAEQKAAEAQKEKSAQDKVQLDNAQATALTKQIEALKAQIEAERAATAASQTRATADDKAREADNKATLQQLQARESESKKNAARVAEETEKSVKSAEEAQKAKALAALQAQQTAEAKRLEAAKLAADAKAKEDQLREEGEKKTAKDAADLEARRKAAADAAAAEQTTKAAEQRKAEQAAADQRAAMAALQAQLVEQGAKMQAQVAANAVQLAKNMADEKARAAKAEQDLKAEFQKAEQGIKAKTAAAAAEEENQKAQLRARQQAAERDAAALAAKAKEDAERAKAQAAQEDADKKKEVAAKKAQADEIAKQRLEAEKALEASKQQLKEAADKQAAEAAAKVAAAKKAQEEVEAKARADEQKAKSAAEIERKAAEARKAEEEKRLAQQKLEEENRAKEDRAKSANGRMTLQTGGRPYGEGFEDPSYSIDTDLCVFSGVGYWPEVRTDHLAELPRFCRPAATIQLDAQMGGMAADSRLEMDAKGRIGLENTNLNPNEPSGWISFSGLVLPTAAATLRPFTRGLENPQQASFIYRNGFQRLAFLKQGDLCVLTGTISITFAGAGHLIRVPEECIPVGGDLVFKVAVGDDRTGLVYLDKNGLLRLEAATTSARLQWVSLSGVSYFVNSVENPLELEAGSGAVSAQFRPVSFTRQGRLCALSGRFGSSRGNGLILRLPGDCRPTTQQIYSVRASRTQSFRVDVRPSGEVMLVRGLPGYHMSLDGIIFAVDATKFAKEETPAQKTLPFNLVTQYAAFLNGYRRPSVRVNGRVITLSGMVRKTHEGAYTDVLGSLPAEVVPANSLMFALSNGRVLAETQVNVVVTPAAEGKAASAVVQWPAGRQARGTDWLSLDGMLWLDPTTPRLPMQLHELYRAEPGNFQAPGLSLVGELCVLQGRVESLQKGVNQANGQIATIPEECRPEQWIEFQISQGTSELARLQIGPNGQVMRYMRATTPSRTFSLDGVVWPTRQFNVLTLGPTWRVYHSSWRAPSFLQQNGLCVLTGSMTGTQSFSPIAYLPLECRPSARLSFSISQFSSSGRIDILSDGRVFLISARRASLTINLDGVFFAADLESLPVAKDLAVVEAKRVPMSEPSLFAENVVDFGDDFDRGTYSLIGSICQLNGRIRAGGMGRVLVTLPAACRPAGDMFFTASNERKAIATVQVNAAGELSVIHGADEFGEALDLNSIMFPVAGTKVNDLELEGEWVANRHASAAPPSFVRVGDLCVLSGSIQNLLGGAEEIKLSTVVDSVVLVLPSACRPRRRTIFSLNVGTRAVRADILPDGSMLWAPGTPQESNIDALVPWVSLAGVRFFADGDEGHELTMINAWSAYSAVNQLSHQNHMTSNFYRRPSWRKEGSICSLSGLVRRNSAAFGSVFSTLPATCRPAASLAFYGKAHLTLERVQVAANGDMRIFGIGSSDWVSLDGMTWTVSEFEVAANTVVPPSKEGTELALLNNFRPYAANGQLFRRPMFTLIADGGVTVLSGVATAPDIQAVLAVLPEAARPDFRLSFDVHGEDLTTAAVDVWPDGKIQYVSSKVRPSLVAYLALDGIMFANKNFKGPSGLLKLNNHVQNYDMGFAPARYHVAEEGNLCLISGVIKDSWNRQGHNGGHIFTLPNECRPRDGRLIFNVVHGRYEARIDVLPDGSTHYISANGGSGDYSLCNINFRLNSPPTPAVFVPNSQIDYHHSYRRMSFNRHGDLCMLSGLIRPSGAQSYGAMILLPPSCRPKERLSFTVAGAANPCGPNCVDPMRVDIVPDGRVLWQDRRSGHWVSLDGIAFIVPKTGSTALRAVGPALPFTAEAALTVSKAWSTVDTFQTPTYSVFGRVCLLSGLVRTRDPRGLMTNLPAPCRPAGAVPLGLSILQQPNNVDVTMRFDLDVTGDLSYVAGGEASAEDMAKQAAKAPATVLDGTVSLSGIMVPAANSPLTALQLRGKWMEFGKGFAAPAFVKQGNLCLLTGFARYGTSTSHVEGWDSDFAAVPAECAPSDGIVLLFANYHSRALRVEVSANGIRIHPLAAGLMTNNFVSLGGISWPASTAEPLKMAPGWVVHANGWRPPSYRVEKGMCMVSGLARRTGSVNLVTTLPADCRPATSQVFNVHDYYNVRRVTVEPNGAVTITPGGPYVGLSFSFRVPAEAATL